MFNMQVSRYENPFKLMSTYRLEWVCSGKKVGVQVSLGEEQVYQAYDPKMVIRTNLRVALSKAIFDLHKDDDCEWCKAATYSLEVVFKNDEAGAEHPTPFWKKKLPTVGSGKLYIGKPGGEDTEWQALGYISEGSLELHSIEPINVETGTVSTLLHSLSAQAESKMLSQKSYELPGSDCWVKYPCECIGQARLRNVIMHLNDGHKWTREAIADWLDSVDDPENGIDLAFKVPEKEE